MLQRFLSSPFFFRASSGLLRLFFPVLKIGPWVVVSRFEDVKEVLERDNDFTIAQINAKRMHDVNIDFFLGMDNSDRLAREKGVMEKIAGSNDLAMIIQLVEKEASVIMSQAGKSIEIVSVLSRVVPLALIEKYYGIPVGNRTDMQRWMRKLFHHLFLNLNDDPIVASEAKQAAGELEVFMNDVIGAQQKLFTAGNTLPDTLLNRLFRLQQEHTFIDTDFIRRNLCGLMIGTVDTTSKCVVLVLQELLRRPEKLREAQELARANDIRKLKNYCYEALRFNPHNPIVVRYSSRELILGRKKNYRIPADRKVAVGIFSAMHDKSAFPEPGSFHTDRPNEYLHFGYGLHACFGRYINAVQIPLLVASVLKRPDPRLKPGKKIVYDGPFPDQFWMEFD